MTASEWNWSFDQHIKSCPDLCPQIVVQLLEALHKFEWSENDCFAIRMAIEEALMNAIKHGNKCNPDKPVHLVMRLTDDTFYARIKDQGCGFDPDAIRDPTTDENVDKPCGRGVMLMKNFVDSVAYNDAGNEVEMTKKRSPE